LRASRREIADAPQLVNSSCINYSPTPKTRENPEPLPRPSVYARTLQKAAELLGSERALARYLRVPLPDLFVWMRPGALPPPEAVFLKAVDLVMNDLSDPDAERAQKLRVAAIHGKWAQDGT
jgi:hypothetical protein